ncbi:hypothetical protein [Streptomyces sindenensis]|uniref:hypothetical protein n=1 Tax=Streptomyces sindenensis TaxID=67363 RepID=UPI0019BB6346|nr:hypothetical protein [Streptomyces sindenensis]GGP81062.1 hypothetical protein GCM10010231_59850 [Streptomyces sindenensis]
MSLEPHEHLPRRNRDGEPVRDEKQARDEELFRDALHRTVGTLSLQPDLVSDAVREGHRRRSRRRGFAVAGAFVAVTALTLGLSALGPRLLPGGDTGPAAPSVPAVSRPAPPPAASSTPSPRPTEQSPDMPSPTTPAPTESEAVPPAPPGPPTPSLSAPPGPGPEETRHPEGRS